MSIQICHDVIASNQNITKYELQYEEQPMTAEADDVSDDDHECRTQMIDADIGGSTHFELQELQPSTKYAVCARSFSSNWNKWSAFCGNITLQTNQFFDFQGRVMLHDLNNDRHDVDSNSISWINSIIYCLSHSLDLKEYFSCSSFLREVEQSDFSQITNEIGCVISKIWSNRTDSISHSLSHIVAAENLVPDPYSFLCHVLERMHHDLCGDPGVAVGSELSMKNQSKLSELFHFQCKSDVTCLICKKRSISCYIDSSLSLPVIKMPRKSFVIDIFHRGHCNDLAMVDDNGYNDSMNKPVRHVFHCNPKGIMKDLAKVIAKKYRVKRSFVLFYENMNQQV